MRRRPRPTPTFLTTALTAALWLTWPAASARAQVNSEALRANPLRPGWSAGLDGSLSAYRGNIELVEVGGSGRMQYQTMHPVAPAPEGLPPTLPFMAQRVFVVASGRFAERLGEPIVSQSFVHARWTAMWLERLGSELFAQYQFNEFLRLQARGVAGAGVRVEMVHEPALLLWGATGYMFEYNRIDVLPGASDAPETFDHRSTSYLAARVALADNRLLLQYTTYYQPRIDRPADFRLLQDLEVQSRVNDVFGLGATLGLLHDSAPPTGVKTTDLRLTTTVHLAL